MKPGPWMVWVRYVFGLLLVGAALYYLRSANKISPNVLLAMGGGIGALAAVGIWKHLVAKEGEVPQVARRRGALVGALTVAMTVVVAVLTGSFRGGTAIAGSSDDHLSWGSVHSREQLVAEVEAARAKGRVTVIDAWGESCFYCKKFDEVIEENPDILEGFLKMHRLRLDLPREVEDPIRDGLGIPYEIKPFMVFIDTAGTIRRTLDIEAFGKEGKPGAARLLRSRLSSLFGEPTKEQAHD